jgi:hypothetical protein
LSARHAPIPGATASTCAPQRSTPTAATVAAHASTRRRRDICIHGRRSRGGSCVGADEAVARAAERGVVRGARGGPRRNCEQRGLLLTARAPEPPRARRCCGYTLGTLLSAEAGFSVGGVPSGCRQSPFTGQCVEGSSAEEPVRGHLPFTIRAPLRAPRTTPHSVALPYLAVTTNLPPSLRPCTPGLYISSACAGGRTNVPRVVARAT